MRSKIVSLLVAVFSLGFAQAASAADMPMKVRPMVSVPAAFTWTGCYVGGYVGGAFAGEDATARDLNGYNYAGVAGLPWSYSLSSSVIGGGTLGCNYQVQSWVFGVEGEAGYINVRGSAFDPRSPFLPLDTEASTKIGDWYGVIAGRAGYTWNRALLYGKVGVAFANVEQGVNDANPAGGNTIFTRTSSTEAALAVGGGLEYALTDNWTVKGEYLYMDFRATDTTCGNTTVGGARFCWGNDFRGVHTAKFGINYLFGMR